MCWQLQLTQHKRFVPYGTHLNPLLTLRTSFMLETWGGCYIWRQRK